MSKFRMLILDDDCEGNMGEGSKGYGLIEGWFPGVFEVTPMARVGDALRLLSEERFDLVLLDVNLGPDSPDGDMVRMCIRWRDETIHRLNGDVWVVGCSRSWQRSDVLVERNGQRILDGCAHDSTELRQELARFLDLHKR